MTNQDLARSPAEGLCPDCRDGWMPKNANDSHSLWSSVSNLVRIIPSWLKLLTHQWMKLLFDENLSVRGVAFVADLFLNWRT